jgi:hypothetical protein
MEFIIVIAVLVFAYRMRRAARQPQQPLRIDIYVHFPDGGPGERQPEPQTVENTDNVVPLRRAS